MGLAVPKDRGKKFLVCAAARKNQGGSIPALKMKEWCQKFNHALDHCLRTELTTSDLTEAKLFTVVETQFLSDYGVDLREESKTQVSYYPYMGNFPLKLKKGANSIKYYIYFFTWSLFLPSRCRKSI